MLAADMLDRMRVQPDGFNAGDYDMSDDCDGFDQAARSTVAAADIAAWQAAINRSCRAPTATLRDASCATSRSSRSPFAGASAKKSTARTLRPGSLAHVPDALGDLTMLTARIGSGYIRRPVARAASASSS
jgi:hypothetical protein